MAVRVIGLQLASFLHTYRVLPSRRRYECLSSSSLKVQVRRVKWQQCLRQKRRKYSCYFSVTLPTNLFSDAARTSDGVTQHQLLSGILCSCGCLGNRSGELWSSSRLGVADRSSLWCSSSLVREKQLW
nr:hypothetical protein Iba_chr14fCG7630 [Ipomoea batatas]